MKLIKKLTYRNSSSTKKARWFIWIASA